jgi:hypothetical protein
VCTPSIVGMTATHATITDSSLAGRAGLVREYQLRNMATGRPTVVSLFDGPVDGPCYEIIDEWAGPAAAEAPGAANLIHFDGPISAVAREAHTRAWDGRLKPAFAALPGTVGNVGMWDPERRSLAVLVLATSLAGLEAIGQAVYTSELLTDEDPALLPGPDRSDIHTVAVTSWTRP